MKYRANARCEIRLRRMKYALHIINHQVYDRNKICPPGIAETKVSGDVDAKRDKMRLRIFGKVRQKQHVIRYKGRRNCARALFP